MQGAATEAAGLLYRALMDGQRIDALPGHCRPKTEEQAYAIQQELANLAGPICGWKVGAPTPTGAPRCAPLLAPMMGDGAGDHAAARFTVGAVEGEVAVRLAIDLPPQSEPYSREAVIAAIGTVHAAIEVLDSRYQDWDAVDEMSKLADVQNNGLFILGEGVEYWHSLKLEKLPVTLTANGETVRQADGGNPAGDPLRLLHWLANERAAGGAGLRAGDIITLGSCTGVWYPTPPVEVIATFDGLGSARLHLEAK
ncbi:MAG: fumarylacetoacetate hydrolase family protein [Aquisalimonadaceae bacterium]